MMVNETQSRQVKRSHLISEVISGVDVTIGAIAAAVEEQTATTSGIAQNIAQASQGIQEGNENATQSSSVASKNISENSTKVETNATELQKSARELNKIVTSFKI